MRKRSRDLFLRLYGAGPHHLVWHLGALGIVAFAFAQMFSGGGVGALVVWLLVFVVAHDLLFVPAYTSIDRLFRRAIALRAFPLPSAINHVRAPALISGLLLIIYFPLISGRADRSYYMLSGHHLTDYLRNWLLITVALFLGSGLIYALRVALGQARRAR